LSIEQKFRILVVFVSSKSNRAIARNKALNLITPDFLIEGVIWNKVFFGGFQICRFWCH